MIIQLRLTARPLLTAPFALMERGWSQPDPLASREAGIRPPFTPHPGRCRKPISRPHEGDLLTQTRQAERNRAQSTYIGWKNRESLSRKAASQKLNFYGCFSAERLFWRTGGRTGSPSTTQWRSLIIRQSTCQRHRTSRRNGRPQEGVTGAIIAPGWILPTVSAWRWSVGYRERSDYRYQRDEGFRAVAAIDVSIPTNEIIATMAAEG